MPKPPKTDSQKIGEELGEERETFGLYDLAKLDYYKKVERGFDLIYDIDQDIGNGQDPKYLPDFLSLVVCLYRDLKPKIKYVKNKDGTTKYSSLYELQPWWEKDEKTGKLKSITELKYDDAVVYLGMMRDLIEDLGITRFEIEKLSLDERIHRDATKP